MAPLSAYDEAVQDLTMTEIFGVMPNGDPVHRMVLANEFLRVCVLSYGAVLQSIDLADRYGRRDNLVLGLTSLEDYIAHSPHFGAIAGRFAGRIARGRFKLDGVYYQVSRNNGANSIHGGVEGFGKRNWSVVEHGPLHAELSLHSADGDQGFPGRLEVTVRYKLHGQDLCIEYQAETTSPTVLNLTSHSYFNLAGEGEGSILAHKLALEADFFVPIDEAGIPIGEICEVSQTPFDFRKPQKLGSRIRDDDTQLLRAGGYDHTFLIRGSGLRRAAVLSDFVSGREMTVLTTEPALQVYTANKLTGSLRGPSGRAYERFDAVCLEAQHVPDSPNQFAFPSTTLRPGHPFRSTTVLRFANAAPLGHKAQVAF